MQLKMKELLPRLADPSTGDLFRLISAHDANVAQHVKSVVDTLLFDNRSTKIKFFQNLFEAREQAKLGLKKRDYGLEVIEKINGKNATVIKINDDEQPGMSQPLPDELSQEAKHRDPGSSSEDEGSGFLGGDLSIDLHPSEEVRRRVQKQYMALLTGQNDNLFVKAEGALQQMGTSVKKIGSNVVIKAFTQRYDKLVAESGKSARKLMKDEYGPARDLL